MKTKLEDVKPVCSDLTETETQTNKSPAYIAVHPVIYVDLSVVENLHGHANRESLEEHLKESAQDGQDHCSYEELEAKIKETADSIRPEIMAFLKEFLADCVTAGACGDILFY